MNKIILSIAALIAFTLTANAQQGVGIEIDFDNGGTIGESALLDFPDSATKGILLPNTTNTNDAGATPGTILFDLTDDKVKYHDNTGWKDMTASSSTDITAAYDLAANAELSSKGVKIEDGSLNETLDGALSLSSSTRALALPKVNGVEHLPGPKAGMMCFDTSRNSLAVFNGKVWTFWN